MQPKAVAQTRGKSRTNPLSPLMRAALIGVMALSLVVLQAVMAYAKPESLAPLAEKISPSVVNITTSTLVEGRTGPRGIVPEGSPFEDFFRDFEDRQDGAPRRTVTVVMKTAPPLHRAAPRHSARALSFPKTAMW